MKLQPKSKKPHKRTFTFFCVVFLYFSSFSQQKDISLPPPTISGGKPLMNCLNERKTLRAFKDSVLPIQQLSDIIWAAFGINRPEKGKRTAPSAMNLQETEIWISTKNGVYLYEPKTHSLIHKSDEDIRSKCGMQPFLAKAAMVFIFVTDFKKIDVKVSENDKLMYASVDIGFISQNVYLYCASENLATVVLGWVNKTELAKKLQLADGKKVMFTQPVGFPE